MSASENSWTVSASGDPYEHATSAVRRYGVKYVLPFVKREITRVAWNQVPAVAATLISFMRCAPVDVTYNQHLTTVLLPGDRALLLLGGKVIGCSDILSGTTSLIPQVDAATSDVYAGIQWRYIISKIWHLAYLASRSTQGLYSDDPWRMIIDAMLKDTKLVELDKSLQSRLQWELKIREGA